MYEKPYIAILLIPCAWKVIFSFMASFMLTLVTIIAIEKQS